MAPARCAPHAALSADDPPVREDQDSAQRLTMDAAYRELLDDAATCAAFETLLSGKGGRSAGRSKRRGAGCGGRAGEPPPDPSAAAVAAVRAVVGTLAKARKRPPPSEPIDDAALSKMARFADRFALADYAPFLWYVPRIVNVVTLAEAVPVPGSGLTLPLNLRAIASKCNGCYYAPKRFAAVQLAFANPRARVLIFRCEGPAAARLAIARAQRQLAVEAGVRLHTRNFQIINQVGAVSLRATLNCEEFALPGSKTERDLQQSFARMLPELLRFSSAARLLAQIPEAQQAHHRVDSVDGVGGVGGVGGVDGVHARASAPAPLGGTTMDSVWSGWGDVTDAPSEAGKGGKGGEGGEGGAAEDMDDDALSALGL